MLDADPEARSIVDPRDATESAGLSFVSDEQPGIRRQRAGKGFTFVRPNGETMRDEATLKRIRKLAIPPAYSDVWICPRADGHTIQATGRDAKGRKQYRYHPQFHAVRESTKYEHMMEFARSLPAIRARIAEHMALRGLPREKVVATVVHLLETTLRNPHVKVDGAELRFQFKGKSGKTWRLQINDRRVAKIVKACQDLPGQELLQGRDLGRRQRLPARDHRPRCLCQRLPHLGRHRAGGAGAVGIRELRYAGEG